VVGVLIALSLILITIYFRESSGGVLHDTQGAGSTVLRPFEVGAERVARPFRDLYGWFSGLVDAKSQRDKLRLENDRLRKALIRQQFAVRENSTLRTELRYVSGRRFPRDYRPVAAAIISKPPSQFEQKVVVAAGWSNGIRPDNPVVTNDGLVGKVTKVTGHTAQVTLLTDEDSAVSAVDLRTSADGIVRHARGAGDTLFLDRVEKSARISLGDAVVTSGWRSGELTSLYPRGIPIGTVTSVSRTDTELYTLVQVTPLVDFSGLDSAIVLVPRNLAGGKR
jgi:rod shape-determining protein MreC